MTNIIEIDGRGNEKVRDYNDLERSLMEIEQSNADHIRRVNVYTDPLLPDSILIGHKGKNILESGFITIPKKKNIFQRFIAWLNK